MIKIGLTQRVISLPDIQENRDSLDQRWASLLVDLGFTPVPIPNLVDDVESFVTRLGLSGVILTGGGDIEEYAAGGRATPERDQIEHALIEHCEVNELSLLGICRGLQALVNHYGGRLTKVLDHVAVRHEVRISDRLPISATKPTTVNSYHDFGVEEKDVPSPLHPFAWAPDSTVEAVSNDTNRIIGIMWHPEREQNLTDWDRALIQTMFGGAAT
jgi:putative glutamine amidotransferase